MNAILLINILLIYVDYIIRIMSTQLLFQKISYELNVKSNKCTNSTVQINQHSKFVARKFSMNSEIWP